ncbi:hypothetical protein D3C72_2170420 [compost metagenome]
MALGHSGHARQAHHVGRTALDGVAIDADAPLGDGQHAGHGEHQFRLARTVGAQHRRDLAAFDRH